ncbi:Uu.00g040770.m01.CDS01 [Anthostomella pinea]|uniref:Uu.00g040770.m01.CDS01 n=1 Tax=Anthostomella pinea TaxID=933095 RepID=A0AAI8YBJ9_9PEZI|nr:Uu.00g040770.m01.CDS01 [Anthostomella pinea]
MSLCEVLASTLSDDSPHKMGAGACGTIYAPVTVKMGQREPPTVVLKRGDGDPARSLRNDHLMHRTLLSASAEDHFQKPRFAIPRCYEFIDAKMAKSQGLPGRILALFPEPYDTLITGKIPSLPQPAQECLTEQYCPESKKSAIKPTDPNWLVRPYLGRRRERPSAFFRLRNFGLCADQMEELGVDMDGYTQGLAESLAFLHWAAEIDAEDVEFVLAPRRTSPDDTTKSFHSASLGDHALWILDFDGCHRMTMDGDGIE